MHGQQPIGRVDSVAVPDSADGRGMSTMLRTQSGNPGQARAAYIRVVSFSVQGGAAAPPPNLPPAAKTFYKRSLPSPPAIAFSSPEGDCRPPRPNASDRHVPAAIRASTRCQQHHLQGAHAGRIAWASTICNHALKRRQAAVWRGGGGGRHGGLLPPDRAVQVGMLMMLKPHTVLLLVPLV